MHQQRIVFIGAGNMARAIIGGLVNDGYPAAAIGAADVDATRLRELGERFAIHTGTDNAAAVAAADLVVLAVKPQVLRGVARELAPALKPDALIVSIAAGIRLGSLGAWLGDQRPIVRVMPNTPALVGSGASALVANPHVGSAGRERAEAVLRAVGLTVWLEDEALLDAVTALSGSGPAYVFLLMEAMEQAGVALGLPAAQARLLTLQTVLGAARLALESDVDPATLRRQVTSPGGTTQAALEVFEAGGFAALVHRALNAANTRSGELAAQYGAD
jgi:pyrroline-5-carboxylate reductase